MPINRYSPGKIDKMVGKNIGGNWKRSHLKVKSPTLNTVLNLKKKLIHKFKCSEIAPDFSNPPYLLNEQRKP